MSQTDTHTATAEETEHDALFSQHANAAWGIAFVTTQAVSNATDAVADGFCELFHAIDDGNQIEDERHEILRMTHAAALRISNGGNGEHAREPVSLLGETKDRQATLALAALPQPLRSTLWLIDGEGLNFEQASAIVQSSTDETMSMVDQARSQFRRFYIDANQHDRLDNQCTDQLELFGAYADGELDRESIALVDTHLEDCDSCRSLMARLVDLESRLHAAIPTIPAWTRQYVHDTWDAIYNSAQLFEAKPSAPLDKSTRARLIGSAVAGLVVIVAIGLAYAFPGDDKAAIKDSASTQLPAPSRLTTTTAFDPSQQSAVATPDLTAVPAETTTTVAPTTVTLTSVTPERNGTQDQRSTSAPVRQTAPVTAGTSSATTTTSPPADDRLVDLPPVPATTTPSTVQDNAAQQ